jgi:hypothetical protein
MTHLQDFEHTTTERLLLRRLQESDLDAVFTLHGDPETSRFSRSGPLSSREAARELLGVWLGTGRVTAWGTGPWSGVTCPGPWWASVACAPRNSKDWQCSTSPSLRVAERLGMRRDRVIDYEGAPTAVYLVA